MTAVNGCISTDAVSTLVTAAEQAFGKQFCRSPDIVVLAPGRVNLMGEHIDYNDGFCLPMAIERYVVVAATLATTQSRRTAKIYSTAPGDSITIPLLETPQPGSDGWQRFVEGVIAGFMGRGLEIPPFDAVVHSNIPLGAGLASSAALEVAVATLLEVVTTGRLDPTEKALLCQQAEHRFAGVPCGIMDQFSSVCGRSGELMLIDCRTETIQRIPFVADDIAVLITNSNVKHALADGEYALRRRQSALKISQVASWRDVTLEMLEQNSKTLSETEFRRARHIISETVRTTDTADAIQQQNWSRVGELMYASHASLQTDFEVSCKELDILVELAQEIGAENGMVGSRMTGGGFGGCTVSLVDVKQAEEVMHTLTSRFKARTGHNATAFLSRPARGAYVLRG
jgi:galactokinase